MILVDTSAWIEFFRRQGDPALKAKVSDAITLGEAAYTCPIRFELVSGALPSELEDLLSGLNFAHRCPLGPTDWDDAGALTARLRSVGATVPSSDLLIAIVADRERIPLLARDQHFAVIRDTVLPDLTLAP